MGVVVESNVRGKGEAEKRKKKIEKERRDKIVILMKVGAFFRSSHGGGEFEFITAAIAYWWECF